MMIEAIKQLVEALEDLMGWQTLAPSETQRNAHNAIAIGRQAIAEAEKQEPVGRLLMGPRQDFVTTSAAGDLEINVWHPVYTSPPQRQPLTQEQIASIADLQVGASKTYEEWVQLFARAIEAAHDIKENK